MAIKKLQHYAIPCRCTSPEPVNVNVPRAWEPRYDELTPSDAYLLRADITGAYTPQGATTDGTHIYRALVADDAAPTWIQKINMATGDVVLERKLDVLGHANDLAFVEGELYVAHSSSTAKVYVLDPATLTLKRSFNLPTTIWGIDYDPVNKLLILGTVGSAYFSVYYNDPVSFMYRIKPQNPYYGMVRQGIACTENYIFVALDNAYGTQIENEKGSRVMVYTWNGIFVKSFYIPIKEIEWCFPHDGKLYVGTYEGRDENDVKRGKIYAIPYDLYPEQTIITGRPTDVSGGVNNLQRLPEGTPVRLWTGSASSPATVFKLDSAAHGVIVDEDGPFRFLRFRFKGANDQVFDWYPENNGVVTLRELDVTAAAEDSTIRFREARLLFNHSEQSFTLDTNFTEDLKSDVSENTLTLTKNTTQGLIEVFQIWGVV